MITQKGNCAETEREGDRCKQNKAEPRNDTIGNRQKSLTSPKYCHELSFVASQMSEPGSDFQLVHFKQASSGTR